MSRIPEELKYTKDHEWIRVEGNIAVEGITDYAQTELSDVVYVELPKVGSEVQMGEKCGTVEAVKAVVDLFAAVSGEVEAVNESLGPTPETVNADPYGEGWMLKIKMKDTSEVGKLMSAGDYGKQLKEAGH
jgi:glycine cleavage system H protein